jgi:LacI family transcriptional regulator
MTVTIKDVARRAGTSIQTVSNYVNGRFGEMSEQTHRRVQEAVHDLGYFPNFRGRSLRTGRSQTLAFLTVDPSPNFIAAPFTSQMIAGITAEALSAGYSLTVHAERLESAEAQRLPPSFQTMLREGRVDGAIVALTGPRPEREAVCRDLVGMHCPFVLLQESFDSPMSASVVDDNFGAGEKATQFLIDRGHLLIGFINEHTIWPSLEGRLAGYRQALQARGLTASDRLIESANESPAGGFEAMNALLDRVPGLTAVLAFNDLGALGALRACHVRGIRVPHDVAVTGFDDFAFAGYTTPPLTTVRMNPHEMGRRSAEMLLAYLATGTFPERHVILPVEVICRETA